MGPRKASPLPGRNPGYAPGLRYSRLLANLLWPEHGVGRGRKIISLTATWQLHHGVYSTASSRRVRAIKITAQRRVDLNTFPSIFLRLVDKRNNRQQMSLASPVNFNSSPRRDYIYDVTCNDSLIFPLTSIGLDS